MSPELVEQGTLEPALAIGLETHAAQRVEGGDSTDQADVRGRV